MSAALSAAQMARLHGAVFTMPRPWTETEIASALADPFGIALSEPQGFLLGRLVAGEAEILTLAVDPAARRRGIGRGLLRRFLDDVRLKGAESVFLEVAASNFAALALYAQAGFLPHGRRKDYYRDGEGRALDALVLVSGLEIPK